MHFCSSFHKDNVAHMDKLVLGVVLLAASLPVAVGLVNGLGLLFALVFIQIFAEVQDPSTVVLRRSRRRRGGEREVKQQDRCV